VRKGFVIAVALVAGGVATACGSGGTSSSSTPTAAATTAGPNRGTCPDLKPGTTGVVTEFCTGPATASVSVGSVSKQLRGGTCQTSAGLLVANIGIVTTHEFVGPRPDFVSVNTPPGGGGGQDVGATVILNGNFYGDSGRFGGTTTVGGGGKTIHFDGTATNGDHAVIDITC
jgi:hypothetical protein